MLHQIAIAGSVCRTATAIERRRAHRVARIGEELLAQLRNLRVALLTRQTLFVDLRALARIVRVAGLPGVVSLLHLHDALRRFRPKCLRDLRTHRIERTTLLLRLTDRVECGLLLACPFVGRACFRRQCRV